MKPLLITVIFLGLVTVANAQQSEPTIDQIRNAYIVCDGHLKMPGTDGHLSQPMKWDAGFEHCALLKKALDDALAAKDSAASLAASKAIAAKLAH
jgi:hypothetical protein